MTHSRPHDTLPRDVLVVEDNVIIAMDVEESLRQMGVSCVRLARNVADAMAAIDARTPDCALLDIELSGETSLSVAAQLELRGVRFAFMSGYDDHAVVGASFRSVPHLRKPFTTDELKAWLL